MGFDFYEIVEVITKDAEVAEFHRREGVILGRAVEDSNSPLYTVYFRPEQKTAVFEECQLRSCGRKVDEAEIYSGETVRVKVREVGGEISDETEH